jgi:hypothetical protein
MYESPNARNHEGEREVVEVAYVSREIAGDLLPVSRQEDALDAGEPAGFRRFLEEACLRRGGASGGEDHRALRRVQKPRRLLGEALSRLRPVFEGKAREVDVSHPIGLLFGEP